MRIVKDDKKKGAKVNEKQVQTRNEVSNIGGQVMIRNEAASIRFEIRTILRATSMIIDEAQDSVNK